MSSCIGIDLGTTFSTMAYLNSHGQPEIIPNSMGQNITPSVIYFGPEEPVVGEEAKQMQASGEIDVAAFFKRSMGDPNYTLYIGEQVYSPIDLSALVLQQLKKEAEHHLGQPVTHVVITVPAYFTNAQREATIKAGQLAGLMVLRIINEPTAAALAYGLSQDNGNQLALVYDLGGGTFDVSLVEITPTSIEVKGSNGDHNLGGKDWDDRLINYTARAFEQEFGIDPRDDEETYHDLLVRAEAAKKSLSQLKKTTLTITHRRNRGRYPITRNQFESLTEDLVERTGMLTNLALAEISLTWSDVTHALLVGGSTRMPMIATYLEKLWGRPPLRTVNPDEAVALGAAIQAAVDMQATQPAGLSTQRKFYLPAAEKTIQDVTSHSLGMIAITEDQTAYTNSIILPKNQPIPSRQSRPYQLQLGRESDQQLEVYLTQGENQNPLACAYLGKYVFSNLPRLKTDVAVIDISYVYDHNGVVNVSAVERSTQNALRMSREPLPSDVPERFGRSPELSYVIEPVTACLAFDLSGSMSGQPLSNAKQAALEFLSQLDLTVTAMGLFSFADRFTVNIAASHNAEAIKQAVQRLQVGALGCCNANTLFGDARQAMNDVSGQRFLIALTDGVWSNQSRAIEEAKQCHQDSIEVIAIGFGGADEKFLKAIASTDQAGFLTSLDNLVGAFSSIAQELTEGRLAVSSTGLRR